MEIIKRRRTIRKFTPKAVRDEQLRLLLEAAMAAPSAHNLQPWHFVVVRNEESRAALAETHEFSGMLRGSPVVIAICADSTLSLHWLEDACLAAENLMIQATALELGAAWVAVYPHADHEAFVRGVLSIPESIRVVCLIPVGDPAEAKPPGTKYDPGKVHQERFGNPASGVFKPGATGEQVDGLPNRDL